jgi:N-formylglutamate deformylase
MILHIPHASTNTLNYTFDCDVRTELELLTDHNTGELFQYNNASRLVFPVSRLISDVKRFEDDQQETMAKVGMGVCYEKTTAGDSLRQVTAAKRQEILETYYRPHHERLTAMVDDELALNQHALIIDCHSYPNEHLPCDQFATIFRPDICIGTDGFHTPPALANFTYYFFQDRGYTVAYNLPYRGCMVSAAHYGKNERVYSVMLKVNRNVYKGSLEPIKGIISEWMCQISKKAAALEEVFDFDEQMTHMFFEGFRWQAEGDLLI